MCTNCVNAQINVKAQAQYEAELKKAITKPNICPCPVPGPAACTNGKCGPGTGRL
jgi:hypothetical protein